MSPILVAEQLTLLEQNKMVRVNLIEFYDKSWLEPEKAPALMPWIEEYVAKSRVKKRT